MFSCGFTLLVPFVCIVMQPSESLWIDSFQFCKYSCSRNGTIQSNSFCSKDACKRGKTCKEDVYTRDENFERAMTDVHNKIRSRVANGELEPGVVVPPAANMRILLYSYDLEQMAQCTAIRCKAQKDTCLATDRYNYVHQVMYKFRRSRYQTVSFEWAIWNLVKFGFQEQNVQTNVLDDEIYTFYNRDVDGEAIGQMETILRAETKFLGCGRAYEERSKIWILVCNYAPGALKLGRPYAVGPACSQCGNYYCTKDLTFPGLCVPPTEETQAAKKKKWKNYQLKFYSPWMGYAQLLLALVVVWLICILFEYGQHDEFD